jgi:hypothetical protein
MLNRKFVRFGILTAVIMNITVFRLPWRRRPHVTPEINKYLQDYTVSLCRCQRYFINARHCSLQFKSRLSSADMELSHLSASND